ncbi:hypothetical protein FGO68_gene15335 [Halteria grandinella]|uniref:Uncharacterized protein n=1 Tax=Halteria grandinella TaxID=5974 RepID=A0A8J8SXI3_HALGN|nr:hypothetical protein FGO68_gene15335 [Halteria grandinella]
MKQVLKEYRSNSEIVILNSSKNQEQQRESMILQSWNCYLKELIQQSSEKAKKYHFKMINTINCYLENMKQKIIN